MHRSIFICRVALPRKLHFNPRHANFGRLWKKFKTRISVDVVADVDVVDVVGVAAVVAAAAAARTLIDHAKTFINMEITSKTNFFLSLLRIQVLRKKTRNQWN